MNWEHKLIDGGMGVLTTTTVLSRLLPDPNNYADWPRIQGWYKLFYVTVTQISNLNKNNGDKK